MAVGTDLAQIKKYLVVYIYPPVPLANKKSKFYIQKYGKRKVDNLDFFFLLLFPGLGNETVYFEFPLLK